jgi:hypothetical protein
MFLHLKLNIVKSIRYKLGLTKNGLIHLSEKNLFP